MAKPTESSHAALIVHAMNGLLKIPQERIAREIGVSFSTVNAWRMGRRSPHASQYAKLRRVGPELIAGFSLAPRTSRELATLYFNVPPLSEAAREPVRFLIEEVLALKSARGKSAEIVSALLERYGTWEMISVEKSHDLEAFVSRAGLGSVKMNAIVGILQRIIERFGSATLALKSADNREAESYLLSLPAVDARIARRVLLICFGRNVFPVDGDVYRVAIRLGLLETSRTPRDANDAFDALFADMPAEVGRLYSVLRRVAEHCQAQNPACHACFARQQCPSRQKSAPSERKILRKRTTGGQPSAIDLFAGCGGLSIGLEEAGFDVRYALDWDRHACATHSTNFKNGTVECLDIRNVSAESILRKVGASIDLVAGGPNCQGVSERGLRSPDDPRNFMFPEFYRIVSQLRPSAFILENVPGLAHRHNFRLLRTILSAFETLGYSCGADVLLAADYGVPQLRYRFVLIGMLGKGPTFPLPTHSDEGQPTLFRLPFVTVWEALSDLPFVGSDRQQDGALSYGLPAENQYQSDVRVNSKTVWNHTCSATDSINLDRASYIPEGGNWKDIPASLLPQRFFNCRMTDHSTTYARLRRDFPAYTITALFGNITAGAFLHPLINRALTIREGARLQSFPDRFVFKGPRHSQYRQIGNAVPPILARAVGSHVKALLSGEQPPGAAPRITSSILSKEEAWDALPVLTPRYRQLFGSGTRWPRGWGPEPDNYADALDDNYRLKMKRVVLAS